MQEETPNPTSTGINGLPSQRSPEELHNTSEVSNVGDDTSEEAWGEVTRLADLWKTQIPKKKDVSMDQGLMQIRI